uniref:Large ribosomal subunit protein uL5c n=1 Tax=Helicosporidium sp. subsp. Simulium jonesii TaxID=145475 RepID=RK5_HELSJ|nr:ribosomal protein L5 [Helicosporidium sp. ex Simulium jonesi]Q2EEW3.1 RecName: Full=Large ribosomal subunit protein uL5c; AltName: Full=50S ribosomal protein L5, plastid [Helicosporidium sp. ex Simulium jonesi]ABD33979.1 ribosomal protein L5 [Helicosporidium sp. ex Simulium jonesi]
MKNDFFNYYKTKIIPQYLKDYNKKKALEVPVIKKIVISRGIGKANTLEINNYIEESIKEFLIMTGQKPKLNRAKKHIAAFKIKKKMILGLSVTLRGAKMYAFLYKFINIILPNIRQFQGIENKQFDSLGNITFPIYSQSNIPELPYNPRVEKRGFNVTINIKAKNVSEAKALCAYLGFPII